MNPISYYTGVLTNFSFTGRARRAEFWWFVLFNIIVSVVLNLVGGATGLTYNATPAGFPYAIPFSIPSLVYMVLVLIQGIALAVRRLHDSNKSGWWLLIAFIPLIGAIVLLVFYILPGTAGANKYGADPKAAG